MRACNSSVHPRIRARESATAPAGSAATTRPLQVFAIDVSRRDYDVRLAMPTSLACVALSGCPMTSTAPDIFPIRLSRR